MKQSVWVVLTLLTFSTTVVVHSIEMPSDMAFQNTQTLETITIPLPNLPTGAKPLEMVLIPAGTFLMGSPDTEKGRNTDEGPQHKVTITHPFYFGKYEVTQAQWAAVMGSNPASSYGVGNNYPVYNTSWNDCQSFIQKLNAFSQGTFRLPTEAEWEYACRAGTTTRSSFGDVLECDDYCGSCTIQNQYMWWCGNDSQNGTAEVGTKLSNPWGLYDMHGNVWEWCQDWYDSSYYSNSPTLDPIGPLTGSSCIERGGSWNSDSRACRSANRSIQSPDQRNSNIGLRLLYLEDLNAPSFTQIEIRANSAGITPRTIPILGTTSPIQIKISELANATFHFEAVPNAVSYIFEITGSKNYVLNISGETKVVFPLNGSYVPTTPGTYQLTLTSVSKTGSMSPPSNALTVMLTF